ncbi:MAG TPA: Rrf2 family transcriptional regulator [Myxococcota bacterium]|jgi:Rrf2 family iron-sulfur cluster assembly transcriptional regulator|nr:Rrf2 family transcriptional regulator [Myxococcota bacterium]
MRLSLQVQYAICSVFDLAYNGHGEPVQVRVVSERQGIPARYLEQIFRRLRRAELVLSKRGPGGGYTLARPPSRITLRDVVEAVEGPLARTLAMEPDPAPPDRPSFLWAALARRLGDALGAVAFDAVCRDAERVGVPRVKHEAPMYMI